MRLDHDEFEVFALSDEQGFTFSSEISLVEFLDGANVYVVTGSLTSFGLPILVASELVKEKHSCYFQKFLSMALYLAVGTYRAIGWSFHYKFKPIQSGDI
ncbi:hypothetical protein TB2_046043 [Malus domestica]